MKRGVPWGWVAAGVVGAGVVTWLVVRARRAQASSSTGGSAGPRGGASAGENAAQAARREKLMPAFRAAAQKHGVPLPWLLAIARKETGFANVRSAPGQRDDLLGGAWGPMQVTSETARVLGFKPGAALEARGQAMLSDPAAAIELGAKYLTRLRGEFGQDLERVAAGYNAGPGRVRSGKIPPATAQRYVPAVVAFARQYAGIA